MSNDNPIVSHHDLSLNPAHSEEYNLTIRILPDGFSFCVFNQSTNKFLALESYSYPENEDKAQLVVTANYLNWLNKIIRKQTLLQLHYSQVIVLVGAAPYTLMPPALFSADDNEAYFKLSHPFANHEKIFSDSLNIPELVIIYSIPILLSDWISSCFPGAQRFHIVRPLIRSLFTRFSALKNQESAFLNIRSNSFDLMILRKGQIFYCNTFRFLAPSDMLYYLLFVFEQLQLDMDKLVLSLMGSIDKKDNEFELLEKYFRVLDILPANNYFQYSHEISPAQLHKYYDLFNATL